MRLSGMIKKEMLQIVRDPSSIAIAFVLPLILLFMFGYGVSLDAKDVPVAIVVDNPTPVTASLTGAFFSSRYFAAKKIPLMNTAQKALMAGRVDGIIWLRGNFTKDVLSGKTASIGVFVNGVDANNGRIIEGYVQGVWAKWLDSFSRANGRKLSFPVNVKYRVWFNPAVRSRNFLVPGLIAIIMTLIGALLTALVIAREWERGTMEALFVTPIRVREILLGKLIPYFILGMGGLVMSVAMAIWLFKVPLEGSMLVLMATSALFLLAALGMGLLISTLAKNQFVAGQAAIITTYLPAFILSGFIFDIDSMPAPIRAITHVIAARYYVSILQTVFAAGDIMAVIIPNSLALLAMAIFFLGLVRIKTKKRLMAS
ncbi:MAG: ABC transporter permease [Deltaproteobacteria bacterium]|nr:ABC transporter permease [Deltaproteobacteria bacterium]